MFFITFKLSCQNYERMDGEKYLDRKWLDGWARVALFLLFSSHMSEMKINGSKWSGILAS